ncbi:MAG: hypothetical protein Sapg2KO_51230 [Saprospiraceae bacterium]
MRYFILFLAFSIGFLSCSSNSDSDTATEQESSNENLAYEPSFFELRTYYANEGKLEGLLKRFEDHTMKLFEKHDMTNIAYWLPMNNEENKLVYLMGYQSKAHRDQAWENFISDPEWTKAWEASRVNGPLVDSIHNTFFTYTAYSPKLSLEDTSPRTFSMRTYYTFPGKLGALHQRFQNHTMEIFENNGMKNIAYFNMSQENPLAKNVLTYFITFPDTTARKASWESFSADPAWKSAYANSIEDGKIVDSLTAELLTPTSFSPLK